MAKHPYHLLFKQLMEDHSTADLMIVTVKAFDDLDVVDALNAIDTLKELFERKLQYLTTPSA